MDFWTLVFALIVAALLWPLIVYAIIAVVGFVWLAVSIVVDGVKGLFR